MTTTGELLLSRRHHRLSDYVFRDIHRENEGAKLPVRARVKEYILRHHVPADLRFLGLPGANWALERELTDVFPRSQCVGLEREDAVVRRSSVWMPGNGLRRLEQPIRSGVVHGFRTSRAHCLNIEFGDFVKLFGKYIGGPTRRAHWHRTFGGFTCAWLDFVSPLCRDLETSLPLLGSRFSADCSCAPLAVSVLRGREHPEVTDRIGGAGGRAEYITWLLNLSNSKSNPCHYVLDDAFEYASGHGSSMLTALLRVLPGSEVVA